MLYSYRYNFIIIIRHMMPSRHFSSISNPRCCSLAAAQHGSRHYIARDSCRSAGDGASCFGKQLIDSDPPYSYSWFSLLM